MTGTVLLDVDGTLVDSTYLHVTAWDQALVAAGHPVSSARIHRGIGMGGPQMLAWLFGEAVAAAVHEEASARHTELFLAQAPALRPLPGARELVEHCLTRGLAVVLATSAATAELEALLGVLALDVEVTAITDADDVDASKPDPELLQVAMARVGADPGASVMVGDAGWDAQAALRAGVTSVGVLSGGLTREELMTAGASVVYEDPADLLARFDSSPLGVL